MGTSESYENMPWNLYEADFLDLPENDRKIVRAAQLKRIRKNDKRFMNWTGERE